jgi:O-antigen/teichoic acid export membrane protein
MWLTISRIISLVLLFLAYTQLFRYLGAYNYGQFQFVLSYVTLFGVVIDFGIQQYVIKKISEEPKDAKKYFHNFLAIETVLAFAVYGIMVGIAYYNQYDPLVLKAIMVAGLGAALHGLTYPFLAVITSFYDLKKTAFLNFLASIINVSVIFAAIYFHWSIVGLVTQQIIYAVLAIILYYRFIRRHIGNPEVVKGLRSLDYGLVKNIFKAALPFALLVGFSTVYNRIDVILITKMLGYTQTGLYSVAYKLFDLMAFFPAVVSHSLYPLFASLISQGKLSEVRSTLERYLRFMIAVALPIGVGGMILAVPLITLLTGSEFAAPEQIRESARVLSVLVWAPSILFIYIVVNALVISQLTKFAMAITAANVLINIVGNIILLPRIGIIGAAIMTLVSELAQGIFYFYFVRRKITDFRFFGLLWKPALASLIMGAVVWQLQDIFLPIAISAGGITYVLALYVLRFFSEDDIGYAKNLLRRGA